MLNKVVRDSEHKLWVVGWRDEKTPCLQSVSDFKALNTKGAKKLGFVEMKPTPFMFPAWLGSWRAVACRIILTIYTSEIGRLLADYASNPIKLCSVRMTTLVSLMMFISEKNDYAL